MIILENLDNQLDIKPYNKYWNQFIDTVKFQLWCKFWEHFRFQIRIHTRNQLVESLEND